LRLAGCGLTMKPSLSWLPNVVTPGRPATGKCCTGGMDSSLPADSAEPFARDGHKVTITTQRWIVDQTSGFVWNLPRGYHPHGTCEFEVTAPDGGTATLTIWGSGEMSCYPVVAWIELPERGVSFFTDRPNDTP
jgi:hypothetical protein